MAEKSRGVRMLTVFKGFVGGLDPSNASGFIRSHEFRDFQEIWEVHYLIHLVTQFKVVIMFTACIINNKPRQP